MLRYTGEILKRGRRWVVTAWVGVAHAAGERILTVNTDWATLIHYGQAILAVTGQAEDGAGSVVIGAGAGDAAERRYRVLTPVYANDLATDHNPGRHKLIVTIGYVALSEDGELLIAFRGTQGIHEWLHDCEFLAVPCPVAADAGFTEDGFTTIYDSLRVQADLSGPSVAAYIAGLEVPVRGITVCGHSLGGALATLLAFDLAVRLERSDIQLYTYASPRLGDQKFVEAFNSRVLNACRIANRLDIVPETPPRALCYKRPYLHVERLLLLPPRANITMHIACMHHITTYLYLLMREGGIEEAGGVLHPRCFQEQGTAEAHLG